MGEIFNPLRGVGQVCMLTAVNRDSFFTLLSWRGGATQFCSPPPEWESAFNPVSLLPKREKGLGDEGNVQNWETLRSEASISPPTK
ncbi:MAG: hypothetical protein EBV05_06125 [Cyanobacteria bacterium WB6_1B_304]|nr:hypothetical protein [Cyanobacteria bacterium WB6_1B_304]